LNVSIILATGKIIDVNYIIFRSIIFIEPLLRTHQPFGLLPTGIFKVLNRLGGVNKFICLPVDQEDLSNKKSIKGLPHLVQLRYPNTEGT